MGQFNKLFAAATLVLCCSFLTLPNFQLDAKARRLSGSATSIKMDKKTLQMLKKARGLWERRKMEEAIAMFKETLAVNPQAVEAYLDLGGIYSELGIHQKVIEMLEIALPATKEMEEKPPGLSRSWAILAKSYIAVGRGDDAIGAVVKAAAEDSYAPEPHRILGELQIARKHYEKALQAYQQAVKLDPRHEDSLMLLARLGLKLRNNKAVQEAYRGLLAVHGGKAGKLLDIMKSKGITPLSKPAQEMASAKEIVKPVTMPPLETEHAQKAPDLSTAEISEAQTDDESTSDEEIPPRPTPMGKRSKPKEPRPTPMPKAAAPTIASGKESGASKKPEEVRIPPETIKATISQLLGEDLILAQKAKDELVAMGEQTLDQLEESLLDPDPVNRMRILKIFSGLGPKAKASVEVLKEVIEDPDPGVAELAKEIADSLK